MPPNDNEIMEIDLCLQDYNMDKCLYSKYSMIILFHLFPFLQTIGEQYPKYELLASINKLYRQVKYFNK